MAATEALSGLERLTIRDVAGALALSREAGWNQTADDWAWFIDRGETFGRRNADGRLVGTAALLPAQGVTWISMVLVTAALRRRGIANGLMQTCIARAKARGLDAWLDATPAGALVYAAMGFEEVALRLVRLRRPAASDARGALPAAGDLERLAAQDRAALGFDRRNLLAALAGRPGSRIYAAAGAIALARDGDRARHVGPVYATREDEATALLEAIAAAEQAPLFIDAAAGCEPFLRRLTTLGFAVERPFQRMRFGAADDRVPPGLFAAAGPEFG